ncbi:alpha-1,2-fucosyltransferase [Porifericola rhodea]|uniref:alpha-1,2-fucosyltransferase n=1 Tax=Porifericola rhodea TaxID=930972 RepID=UPI002666F747|nr:alpha-1,2-fucosyltransferase [Porifericola rhodea]WKN33942.1 alpha-1,2-fucosyltransferase [Porifericola rhodea]
MIVIINKSGQLANRLFLMANFIAFSNAHEIKIYNPSFDEYAKFFEKTSPQALVRFPISTNSKWRMPYTDIIRSMVYQVIYKAVRVLEKLNIYESTIHCILDIGLYQKMPLDSAKFINLARKKKFLLCKGWAFRDETNFSLAADIIKPYFKPLPCYLTQAITIANSARSSENTLLVGVHIRRGDYKTFLNGKYFFPLSVYISYINKVQSLFPGRDIKFIVCSNETIDVRVFKGYDVVLEERNMVVDLALLAACDYIIGPPSTFSIWASYYGDVPLYKIENEQEQVITLDKFTIHGK